MTPHDSVPHGSDDPSAHAVAAKALELIADGARIGLGAARAGSVFIAKLGTRAREGLRVSGVPTSQASAAQAREVGIPLIELGEVPLDITVDGARPGRRTRSRAAGKEVQDATRHDWLGAYGRQYGAASDAGRPRMCGLRRACGDRQETPPFGPNEADALIAADGGWHNPEPNEETS